ncbi:MAG: D-lyxose/D-mannose family sugar isomerase [Victivallales bacterium]|jgi:hypothetical protein
MKRSEINQIMRDGVKFAEKMKFLLPSFAYWTPGEWRRKGHEYDEIRDNMLGWDITDFGSGDFSDTGLLLFTIRNGSLVKSKYIKPYAEKILIVEEEQITPYHFHWQKMEDIINRGGGNLLVKVYGSTKTGEFSKAPVKVSMDGRNYTVKAGTVIKVSPGQSITLPAGQYHKFWGEKGSGKILLGEISRVNDDRTDNRFYEKVGRFPEIVEDTDPLYLLSNEYPPAKKG